MMLPQNTKLITSLLLVISLSFLIPLSFEVSNQRELLDAKFYFHRDFSGIDNYRMLNMNFPVHPENYTFTFNYTKGIHEIGSGWISPKIPKDITLTRRYNFLFGIYSNSSLSKYARFFFKFYVLRGSHKKFLFKSSESNYLSENMTCSLWQHQTKNVTLNVKKDDRLILHLFINIQVVDYYFEVGYDCIDLPSFVQDPTEIRYLRSDTHKFNELEAFILNGTQSTTQESCGYSQEGGADATSYFGVKIWKKNNVGTETELTSGVYELFNRTTNGEDIQTGNWTCPSTSMNTEDAVVLRIYFKHGAGTWTLGNLANEGIFITEQLGASQLENVNWNISLYTKRLYTAGSPPLVPSYLESYVYFGISTKNSSISNFQYTEGFAPEEDYIDLDWIDVDASSDKGSHSNFTTEKIYDSTFDNLTEAAFASYENFSAYTLVGTHTTFITDYWIEADPYDRDVDEYIYDDKGTEHFEDFEHGYDVLFDSDSHNSASFLGFWGVSNSTDDLANWNEGLYQTGEEYLSKFYCRIWEKGGSYDTAIINLDTWYYMRILRTYTTFTLKIYSSASLRNANGTADVDTLQISVSSSTYRYQYALCSFNSGHSARDAYGQVKNLDLMEAVNYQLDLEVQFYEANYTRTYEDVCIRTGTLDAEDLEVYVWNVTTSTWNLLYSDLASNSWNNVSVTDHLSSDTLTLKFLGGTETSDTNQDSWQIESLILRTSYTPLGNWFLVETWYGEFVTRAWTQVESWYGILITRSWQSIESWYGQIITRAWTQIETWHGTLSLFEWINVIFWILLLTGTFFLILWLSNKT